MGDGDAGPGQTSEVENRGSKGRPEGASAGRIGSMPEKRHSPWLGALLWFLALALMMASAVYQRRTGPTYPLRGEVQVAGDTYSYALIRSQETTERARVALPRPGGEAGGVLAFRRYPTDDAIIKVVLDVADGEEGPELVGYLPVQPAAGKVEYYLELDTADGLIRVPDADAEESTIILRYKDPVPTPLLIAHVLMMFFSVLVGMRAGLGALVAPGNIRKLTWITLFGMTVGGLVLGPFVQKYAFGEYWTGFPWGYDLTDNKLLIMWIVWVLAALALGGRSKSIGLRGRLGVILAALVMTGVYLIPHSMRGSEARFRGCGCGRACFGGDRHQRRLSERRLGPARTG